MRSCLPRPKHLTHQALGHERFQAETLLLHFFVELVDEEVVVELHGAAGGVGEELADEVAAEVISSGVVDDLFEAGEVRVGLAGGEFAGGVDLRSFFGVFWLRVGFAPAANGIEGFEAEAKRVYLAMALGAGGIGAVFGESVADGGGPADVGIDRGHDIRRRWRRDAEDVFTDPHAAGDGRGFDAIRADGQHGGHAEQTAAMVVAFEADFLEAVGEA